MGTQPDATLLIFALGLWVLIGALVGFCVGFIVRGLLI